MPELPVPVRIQSSYLTVLRYLMIALMAIAALMMVLSVFYDDLAQELLKTPPWGWFRIGAAVLAMWAIAYFLLGVRSFEFSNDWVEIKRPWGQQSESDVARLFASWNAQGRGRVSMYWKQPMGGPLDLSSI